MTAGLSAIEPEKLERALKLVKEYREARRTHRVLDYKPYGWQAQFHEQGASNPERMLIAANRVGKTFSAACETAYHMTGLYPDWWVGHRFDKPVLVWTGSPTNETSRDIVQHELIGDLGEGLGTGLIPKSRLIGKPTTRQAGVKNVADQFLVRHASGGVSTCIMKTYEQGWQKWQGTALHVVWMDEEPDDYMVYTEAQTRILSSGGILYVTFTPLLGMTELVQYFYEAKRGTAITNATWDDAPHLDSKDKDALAERYPAYQRDARTKGIPMLGEGAVFPVAEDQIRVDPFRIPEHFARIKGCDFGIDHPAAGVEIAWNRDQDVIYVIDCYRKAGETVSYHATWFMKANKRIPVAWPHDGVNREKSGGKALKDAYIERGVPMLGKSAHYRPRLNETPKLGPQPVEPIVQELLERMQTGRFKVFANLAEWFEEYRSYHRKDGRIVDRRDDILKATMYAVMMRRYAIPLTDPLPSPASVPVLSMRL